MLDTRRTTVGLLLKGMTLVCRTAPSVIGYAGAYDQWPNNWKAAARGGLQ